MYLDTVNYKDLRVSQRDFLAHLSEAGIPEAELELRSLQRQQAAAEAAAAEAAAAAADAAAQAEAAAAQAAAADAAVQAEAAAAEAPTAEPAEAAAAGAMAPSEAGAPAAGGGSEAGGSRQEGSPGHPAAATAAAGAELEAGGSPGDATESPGPADVLAERGSSAEAQTASEDSSATAELQHSGSPPATPAVGGLAAAVPTQAAPAPADSIAAFTPASQLSDLTPNRQQTQSPEPVMATQQPPAVPLGVVIPPIGAGSPKAAPPSQQRQRPAGGQSPSGLTRRLQYERAAAAAGAPRQLEEPAFVTDMVADGMRHVLEAEAKGQLQAKYPYMYASAADLALVSPLGAKWGSVLGGLGCAGLGQPLLCQGRGISRTTGGGAWPSFSTIASFPSELVLCDAIAHNAERRRACAGSLQGAAAALRGPGPLSQDPARAGWRRRLWLWLVLLRPRPGSRERPRG